MNSSVNNMQQRVFLKQLLSCNWEKNCLETFTLGRGSYQNVNNILGKHKKNKSLFPQKVPPYKYKFIFYLIWKLYFYAF